MRCTACFVPQFLYSKAINLHPIWAVKALQILSAFIVQIYLYYACEPYSLYTTSVPVEYCY